ncbi:MAG: hypothetical protein LBT21_06700 [Oscillospiraceae bacterium]|jgi:hypothetical protein|nr:hypothetical protein [Oscillospiraceae bacterium]
MFDYYREHWYLLLLLLALAVCVVLVWRKALRKRAEVRRTRAAITARLDEQKAALDAYRAYNATRASATNKQIFMGFALDIQSRIQKEIDLNAAFAALPQASRELYALYFALEDEPGKLSKFFKLYGKPLTTEALAAMHSFADADSAELFAKMHAAYDPDDENSSLIPAQITEWDAAFANTLNREAVYSRAAECIKSGI